jgi:hypothetical protein
MIDPHQSRILAVEGCLQLHSAVDAPVISDLIAALSTFAPAHARRNLLRVPIFRRFASGEQALAVIAPILGPGAFPVRATLFDKLPSANWKVPWHQDLAIAVREKHEVPGFGPWSVKEGVAHVQPPLEVLENMLTLRLHLDDCFANNGPLRVLPGTHRYGILAAARIQELRQSHRETAATLSAGGILLMRPLLLHASSSALNPGHRRVLHIDYAAAPLPEPLQWHAA